VACGTNVKIKREERTQKSVLFQSLRTPRFGDPPDRSVVVVSLSIPLIINSTCFE
jgi:hypothetical protein